MKLKYTPHDSGEWLALASAELTDGARIRSAHITYGTLLASMPRPDIPFDEKGRITLTNIPEMGWPDVVALIAPGANLDEVASELEHLARIFRERGALLLPANRPREEEGDAWQEIERSEQLRIARAGEAWLSNGESCTATTRRVMTPHED